jgi:acetylornithine deacetylase
MIEAAEILRRLVAVEGVTGCESGILAEAAALVDELGLAPVVSPDGVIVTLPGVAPGPTLLCCSHLDTVPAGDGWRTPPYAGAVVDGWLHGRGAVDARASCAAFLAVARHFAEAGLPRGRLVVALSIGEEGDDPSLPRLLDAIGPIDAGLVGEPTRMNIASSQRGLLVLELTARGPQGHAARTHGANAIHVLARDLVALETLRPPRAHPSLGRVKITPTRLQAGVADNMTAPVATALVDVRTTPAYETEELLALIREAVESTVAVRSDLWPPCETPPAHPLALAAKEALPQASVFASDAASDWAFLQRRGIPGLKLGPGDPTFSHAPDERIALRDFTAAVADLIRLTGQCLARLPAGKAHA